MGKPNLEGLQTREGIIDNLLNKKIKGYEQIRNNLRNDEPAAKDKVQEGDGRAAKQAGNRLFNQPIKAVAEIANRYYERVFGKPRPKYEVSQFNESNSTSRIA